MTPNRGPGGGPRVARQDRLQHLFAVAAKHQGAGRLAEAERGYRAILTEQPGNVGALNNLARVQQVLGRPGEAAANYRRALAIAPNDPRLHVNLGNVLSEQNSETEAIAAYRRALALMPAMPEAHNNLGGLLQRTGDLRGAARCYQDAVALRPEFAEPLGNLARIRLVEGDLTTAVQYAVRYLTLSPGREAQRLLAHCLRDLSPQSGDPALRTLVERALAEVWDRPAELAGIAGRLICLAVGESDDVDAAIAALASDKLLATLLVVTPVASVELERLLTGARQYLLRHVNVCPDLLLPFACVLAQQCFLNEYVFAQSDAESEAVAALRMARPLSPFALAVLASYQPLQDLSDAAELLQAAWPEAIRPLLRQQVSEPVEETRIRASIPVLTAIDDAISQAVREQYEENPYPRWSRPAPIEPVPSIDHLLRAQFAASRLVPLARTKAPEILIAGCGTGRQPIEVARQFPSARVLAIDLSLASLAYAQRKARELGGANVEFAQADLLHCDELGRSFDMIQATGVLHHLRDPLEGWRALAAILRPRGVMQIGLYSEIARRPVTAACEFIAARGYRPVPDEIRRCRQDMLASGDDSLQWVRMSRDFYYLSACRDLLFHVQEARLTLRQIDQFLTASGLVFIGFELEPAIAAAYRTHNSDDKAMTDLAAWHAFEIDHPEAFRGMYQFWIQKQD